MFSSRKTSTPSGGILLTKSLRFRSSAPAYLNRTIASTPTSWTASFWVKRGQLGSTQTIFGSRLSGTGSAYVEFLSNDTFGVANNSTSVATNAVYRDPSAWYHFTVNWTSGNSVSIYCNGVLQSVTGSISGANQLFTSSWTNTIGRYGDSASQYLDGYLADVYFIDGQALTASSFGSFSGTGGVWKPIAYSGTYGTNGFHLTFTNTTSTTTLGYDTSGNSNNWTTNNISLTAGSTYDSMNDVPTLTSATAANYCVLNPLAQTASGVSLTNGNLYGSITTAIGIFIAYATIGMSSGKWYWEVTCVTGIYMIGIGKDGGLYDWQTTNGFVYFSSNGNKYTNSAGTAYGASYTTGDVIGVALDMDAGTLAFYKNGTSQGTAFSSLSGTYFPCLQNPGATSTQTYNFGQQPFTYTAPSGFKALNTYNLPTPTIANGRQYMDATLYTGTGASASITNSAAFKPDLVWIKSRSAATDHKLTDSVRGVTKGLISDTSGAETTDTQGLTAFNGNGFTLGTDTNYNNTSATYVGWQWQAGAGTSGSNTNGSITSTVSANTTSGFSIVTYTGSGTAGTIGHGLGVAPSMIIVKSRSATGDWPVYHSSVGNGSYALLDTTAASAASSTIWNATSPTSSVFSVGINTVSNTITVTYVAYCFTQIAGFSAFGSYTGNGSATGPFIYTGFQPKYLLVKRTDSTSDWYIWDSVRNTFNIVTNTLLADTAGAETSASSVNILSNGFQCVSSTVVNASGGTYIYAAFASNPFAYSNAF